MEIKLFGKSLFQFMGKGEILYQSGESAAKASKFLPDFHSMRSGGWGGDYATLTTEWSGPGQITTNAVTRVTKGKKTKTVIKQEPVKVTPKGVYNLKMLNDASFRLNTDPKYIDEQIVDFKEKLSLIKSEEYDMSRGTNDIASIVMRLENRKKYPEVKAFFDEYPYTTTTKINDVIKTHSHLKLDKVAQFVADMPKDAIRAMKNYNINTDKISGKQAVFYVIADKKDYEKTDKRKDPILLAQSPFGHFWQILGAWDEEMLFLEEL